VVNGVLPLELRLVVLAKERHRVLRSRLVEAQPEERVARGLEARREGLAMDDADTEIAQPEVVDAVAGARDDLEVREVLAHHGRRFDRRLHVVDRKNEQLRILRLGRVQKLETRGVPVINPVAETADEIHLGLAHFECREPDAAHPQHA